jgi:2-oxoglutarate dehydrogenase E1 component
VVRLEQLYPFHDRLFAEVVAPYRGAREVVWVQEETKNRGGWTHMMPLLQERFLEHAVRYVGREASASPATGSGRVHRAEQQQIIDEALAP